MFGIFGQINNEDRIINTILKKMKPNVPPKLFYGNVQEAGIVLKPLRKKLYPGKALASFEQYRITILFYAQVWIRTHGGLSPEFMKKEYICEAIRKKFSQFPSYTVDHAIDICLDYINKKESTVDLVDFEALVSKSREESKGGLETPESEAKEESTDALGALMKIMEMLKAREAINQQAGETAKGNEDMESKYLDDPEYGLVREKPIFVKGFGAHRDYLNRLRTESGANLEYSRLGSMAVDGIAGRVDQYSITPRDGSDGMMIFLCLYGNSNSTTAPKGLKLVNTLDGDSSNTEAEAQYTFF